VPMSIGRMQVLVSCYNSIQTLSLNDDDDLVRFLRYNLIFILCDMATFQHPSPI